MRVAAKMLEKQHAAHPCGPCQVCCTVKAVSEIDKPEFTACPQLVPPEPEVNVRGGCSIYKDRPESCRNYFCAYRHGIIGDGEMLRPDMLGVIFDVAEAPPPGIMMLAVREARPNAIEEAMPVLNAIAAQGAVLYIMRGDKRHFMGSEDRVRAAQEWGRRHLPLVAR